MRNNFRLAAVSIVGLMACALWPIAEAQAQTPAAAQAPAEGQAKAGENCAELAEKVAKMEPQVARLKDWPALGRYREDNANVAAPAKGEQRVVFMGDSITDAWVQPRFGGFFPGKPYIGRGISGQTTPQMLVRFRADVIALQPQVVVFLAGTNDLAGNTGPITLEETEGNLASMAELARAHGIRVVLASVMPVSNYGHDGEGKPIDMRIKRPPEKILELNAWIKKYAAVNDHVYLNYFSAMVDEHGLLKKELSDDGLHPNAAGYGVMTPLAEKAIQEALREIPASAYLNERPVPVAEQTAKEQARDLYGLYYLVSEETDSGETALVINPDGNAIPPKENDPDAPTLTGLHISQRHFQFAWARLSPEGFAFRTVSIQGSEYSFEGKFGREQVGGIPYVPYLVGVLTEKKNSQTVQNKEVKFGHAVVL